LSGDCDDADSGKNPGVEEIEDDGIDQDCTGSDLMTWYEDSDSDGYGNSGVTVMEDGQPENYVSDNTDCDDEDPYEHPEQIWYVDEDGDGYTSGVTIESCLKPGVTLYVVAELSGLTVDCDDDDAGRHPGVIEIPDDGLDQNCDDYDLRTWYKDEDGDGYSSGVTVASNFKPDGYKLAEDLIAISGDCSDSSVTEFPGQVWYVDEDRDGFTSGDTVTSCLRSGTTYLLFEDLKYDEDSGTTIDCLDSSVTEYPGQVWYVDEDGDRFTSGVSMISCMRSGNTYIPYEDLKYDVYSGTTIDCLDSSVTEFPGQIWYVDGDGDGFTSGVSLITCMRSGTTYLLYEELSGVTQDCDDSDPEFYPGAYDKDCTGRVIPPPPPPGPDPMSIEFWEDFYGCFINTLGQNIFNREVAFVLISFILIISGLIMVMKKRTGK